MTDPRRLSVLLLPLGAGLFAASSVWVSGAQPGQATTVDAAPVAAPSGPSDADLATLQSAVNAQLARVHALQSQVKPASSSTKTGSAAATRSTSRTTAPRTTTAPTTSRARTTSAPTKSTTAKPKPKPAPAPAPVKPPTVSTPAPPTHTKTGASGSR